MTEKNNNLSRRQFMKTAGIAGVGAALIGNNKAIAAEEKAPMAKDVPRRAYGKTGEMVSILALGGIFDTRQNQLLLNQALKMGVTYWDTAEGYINGASEEGMGQYFEKYPEDRKKVFLVSKAKSRDPEGLTKSLAESLKRLKTSYIDMYFLHGIDNTESLTPEVRKWVEKTKAEGKIKNFGFSAHTNVEDSLEAASKLGWIDGIMMAYSFRTMNTDRMKAAVDACAKAGIGLTAMKTQAKMPSFGNMPRPKKPMNEMTKEERDAMMARFAEMAKKARNAGPDELSMKMTERFRKKGFSIDQAKLKLIWENPNIVTICSAMYNMAVLKSNVDAAIGKVQLTQNDRDLLASYASCTSHQHCPGCTRNCQVGIDKEIPIGIVMRCLMYARDYGDRDLGKTTYRELPSRLRSAIPGWDYSAAEQRCPNNLPIGTLMREAAVELA